MTSPSEIQSDPPIPALAVMALVALVAAILTAVVHYRPRPAKLEPPAPEVEVPALPEVEPATAVALIDAIPWGRIERIETPGGGRHALPEQRETPVLLELPAGAWRVVLSNPLSGGERTCDLELDDGARGDCRVEFERLTVDQYFREAGWWR